MWAPYYSIQELGPLLGALQGVLSVVPHPICKPVLEFLSENGRHMMNTIINHSNISRSIKLHYCHSTNHSVIGLPRD
jgi:hypothetical protein